MDVTITVVVFLDVQFHKRAGKASHRESQIRKPSLWGQEGPPPTKHPLLVSSCRTWIEPLSRQEFFSKWAATQPMDTMLPAPQHDLSSYHLWVCKGTQYSPFFLHRRSLSQIRHLCFKYFYFLIPGLLNLTVSFLKANTTCCFIDE